ncbi:MAG TPA: hypothetical protein VGE12_01515 [Noviherbaspirillum sp.]
MRSATGETPEGGPASTPTHPDAVQAPGPAGTPTASAQGDASAPAAVEADATRARFNQPLGIAVDDAGNLYIADALNHTIRKIAPSGVVTTLAGMAGASGSADGTGAAARFSGLKGIALDDAGNIYAVDHGAIRKITPSGLVTTLAGAVGQSGDADGAGPSARFRQPWGIAADAAGNLYVADTDNYLVRKITPSGTVSTHAGTRGMRGTANGSTGSATFLGPMGITADPAGNLYLTDWFGPPAPNIPEGSTFIRRIGADGSVTTVAGNFGGETGPAVFSDTFALAADADGNVMVATARSVRKVGPSGTVTTVAGPSDGFQALNGIAMDGAGNLFVTDASNHTVSKVTPDGTIAPVAGAPGQSGSSDEPATP